MLPSRDQDVLECSIVLGSTVQYNIQDGLCSDVHLQISSLATQIGLKPLKYRFVSCVTSLGRSPTMLGNCCSYPRRYCVDFKSLLAVLKRILHSQHV